MGKKEKTWISILRKEKSNTIVAFIDKEDIVKNF